jgi:hypothetical protein
MNPDLHVIKKIHKMLHSDEIPRAYKVVDLFFILWESKCFRNPNCRVNIFGKPQGSEWQLYTRDRGPRTLPKNKKKNPVVDTTLLPNSSTFGYYY